MSQRQRVLVIMTRTLSLILKEENMEFIISLVGTVVVAYIFLKIGWWIVSHLMSAMGCLLAFLLLPTFLFLIFLIF